MIRDASKMTTHDRINIHDLEVRLFLKPDFFPQSATGKKVRLTKLRGCAFLSSESFWEQSQKLETQRAQRTRRFEVHRDGVPRFLCDLRALCVSEVLCIFYFRESVRVIVWSNVEISEFNPAQPLRNWHAITSRERLGASRR